MGGVISTVAFPAPQLPEQLYEQELETRRDLVWLKTIEQERIPACHVRAKSSSSFLSGPTMTILYSHGNAEDLMLHLDYIDALAHFTGSDVFSYEYLGYSMTRFPRWCDGGEPATASEEGCIRSIDAAWRYLVDEQKIPPNKIVIFGRSIGSGPSVDLASRETVEESSKSPRDVAGVLLQSPLESGARAVLGPVTAWVGYGLDIFKNYEKIENISAPVFIMHGTADEVVPFHNGEALQAKLQRPYEMYKAEGYGHNNMPQEMCFDHIKDFIRHVSAQQTKRT
eukprot:TRINITY_DN20822_c0_g1_i1.p1 TRINITY_DN20822_c0_g1~~TRINITY_DN20822_c0_g1_i1.p1  ORF type:complete len:282 (+),score=64.33 TRINITY_DN20822_c0_g1_i1:133-978(+)